MKKTMNLLKKLTLFFGLVGSILLSAAHEIAFAGDDGCEMAAHKMLNSGLHLAKSEYWLAVAKAQNLPSKGERREAIKIACLEYSENRELIAEQYEARKNLCENLDEQFYHPVINPDDFVDVIDNPYFPLTPGTIRRYEKQTEEGLEVITFVVTGAKRNILGVECTVIRDTVTFNDELIEDTLDYFAQDTRGNVWYFGELAMNFENGELADLGGSWTAGVDGAKPGIVMEVNPQLQDIYRQEFYLGEAEDGAKIVGIEEVVETPLGVFSHILKTLDFTPITPDHFEYKYYAPGIGLVLEENPETGERTELVNVQ